MNSARPGFSPRPLGSGSAQRSIQRSSPNPAWVCTGAVTARGLGAVVGGGVVGGTMLGPHGEHHQFLGSVPGKEVGAGANVDGVATMRWPFTVWRLRFIDGKPTRWLKAEVEGSCSTESLRGGVRQGKSDETMRRFSQNPTRRRPSSDRAQTRCKGEGIGVFHDE
jgi:hypothetical protein